MSGGIKSKKWKKKQRARQGFLCAYCKGNLRKIHHYAGGKRTLEHIVPRSWGGPVGGEFNIIIVCFNCNTRKSTFENFVNRDYPDLCGLDKCIKLMQMCWDIMSDEKQMLRYGKSLAFRYMRFEIERAISHPDWAHVVAQRRELFFGEPTCEKSTEISSATTSTGPAPSASRQMVS